MTAVSRAGLPRSSTCRTRHGWLRLRHPPHERQADTRPASARSQNESKAILEDIRTNTLGTRNNTSQIIGQLNDLNAGVDHLDATTQAGFENLAAGTAVLIQLGQQANVLAAENVEQNKTIICWLTNIAHVLCEMKRDLDASLLEQRETVRRLAHVDSVLELARA